MKEIWLNKCRISDVNKENSFNDLVLSQQANESKYEECCTWVFTEKTTQILLYLDDLISDQGAWPCDKLICVGVE